MPTNLQVKKKARSFSLTDEEHGAILRRAKRHGFSKSEYLIALCEVDAHLRLSPTLDAHNAKILRPINEALSTHPALDAIREAILNPPHKEGLAPEVGSKGDRSNK